jgi:uncharacterized protein involved in response to NO
MNAIPKPSRAFLGAALFSYGFRPFFLFGALYAGLAILVWLPTFYNEITVPTTFTSRDWHVHELLYGYLPAVIAGFLLTAIPNWTGRLPLQGPPLWLLLVVWVAGRLAITFSAVIGASGAAVVDASFLFLLAAVAAREIVLGQNWRNVRILLPVLVLGAGNVVFHIESHLSGVAEYGLRMGIAAIIVLIMLIGGRVIPTFTRNWLLGDSAGRLPSSFASFDAVALVVGALSLVLWIVLPMGTITGVALLSSCVLQTIRLLRWAGDRTLANRLVLVLHVAYAFVPLGFGLTALAAFGYILPSAGLHAWMIGGAGMMTLAVMTRATLGHTGRALEASFGTHVIYIAMCTAAMSRLAAVFLPAWNDSLLHTAAFSWIVAFGGFCLVYGPMLIGHRLLPSTNEPA